MSSSNDRYDGSTSQEDTAVSRMYRESATETTPPRLDNEVLAEARKSVRPRLALPANWMRPLAWTVTAGLCFAIAVDLYVEPEGSVEWNGGIAEQEPQAAAPLPTEVQTPVERREKAADAAPRDEGVASMDQAAPAALNRQNPTRAAERPAFATGAPMNDAPAIEAEEASNFARLDSAAALSEHVAELCEADDIVTPDAWFACIEALEAEGHAEEAAAERRRFNMKYPNYDVD